MSGSSSSLLKSSQPSQDRQNASSGFKSGNMPPRKRRYSLRWKFERGLRPEGVAVIAGVDEVGRGCWAGPVYAAAAILPDGLKHPHLNDSKQLPVEHRTELNHFLCGHTEVR